jgi:protein-L-isoaspartate(D-aspartate) O-methyltransferase
MTDYAPARQNMVENQLRPNKVDDPGVLAAMGDIPRELFCPNHLKGVAYIDDTIEVAPGEHLVEPMVLAWLIQGSTPRPDDVALVVGCDTGYAAAVLARLVATVFLLVHDESVVRPVEDRLSEIGCDNVVVRVGPAAVGQPEQAPFDIIILGGGVESVPPSLTGQLGEGGRLAAVVGKGQMGKVTIFTKVGNALGRVSPFDAGIPALASLRPAPSFEF